MLGALGLFFSAAAAAAATAAGAAAAVAAATAAADQPDTISEDASTMQASDGRLRLASEQHTL
jgi:hypothetical protein